MQNSSRLSSRFPVGTKYVLESKGSFVRRYVELPNGHKIQLETRKAETCHCAGRNHVSIIPDPNVEDVAALDRRHKRTKLTA